MAKGKVVIKAERCKACELCVSVCHKGILKIDDVEINKQGYHPVCIVSEEDCELLCVLNANRPETDTVEGMIEHLHSIEIETGLKFHGVINNTHLLRETTAEDIVKGYKLCRQVSDKLGIPIAWNTCREDLMEDLNQLIVDNNIEGLENIYPIKLYMRPSWLDR